MGDTCPTCGRHVGWAIDECRRGLYDTTGPAEARDCERASKDRAESELNRLRDYLAWSREWHEGDGVVAEAIRIMDQDAIELAEWHQRAASPADLSCVLGYEAGADRLAEVGRERDEARDCGQDGVCAVSPGCQRHWEIRCRELLAERDEARHALTISREAFNAGVERRENPHAGLVLAEDWYRLGAMVPQNADAMERARQAERERDEARALVGRLRRAADRYGSVRGDSEDGGDAWAELIGTADAVPREWEPKP